MPPQIGCTGSEEGVAHRVRSQADGMGEGEGNKLHLAESMESTTRNQQFPGGPLCPVCGRRGAAGEA